MTSKTSLNNFHPARNLFRYTVRRNMGLTVLVSIFMLLICPGYILMYIQNALKISETGVFDFNKTLPALITSVTAVTTAVAILFLYINFNFLYAKNASDLFHSLPLNRRGLLLSRFFASIVPVFIPIVLTYASMCGLTAFKKVGGDIRIIIFGFIFNILIIFMCCAFTTVFIICAGSVFDLIVSFLSVNIGVILAVMIGSEIARAFLIGYTDNYMKNLLMYSSPFFFSFANFVVFLNEGFEIGSGIVFFTVKMVALTAALTVSAVLLYNHRKSEKSGVSYAYRFIYIVSLVVVSFVGAFALGSIFSNGEYNVFFWIFSAVGGVLTAITFGAINDRGFKTVRKSAVMGGCSFVALVLITVIMMTGGFGFSARIPSGKSVKSVTVQFDSGSVEFENPSIAMGLHKQVITGEQDTDSENAGEISFLYKLSAGRTLNRSFYVDYSAYMDKLMEIYKSKENIDSIRKSFKDFKNKSLSISEYKPDDSSDINLIQDVGISYTELEKIVDAYCNDLLKSTEKSITREGITEYSVGAIDENHGYSYNSLYVEESFTATKEAISALKLENRASVKDYQ